MLAIDVEQADALAELDRQRLLQSLSLGLAEVWPAIAQRAGDRFGELVAAAASAAQAHGFSRPRHVAALASLWCVWGPRFEERPGFEWARAILAARDRAPHVRLHQLAHATRDALAQRAGGPGAPTVAQFDDAWARLAAVARAAAARGVFLDAADDADETVACDLAALELRVVQTQWRQDYRRQGAGYVRQPVAVPTDPLKIEAPLDKPVALAALGPARRGAPASRLALRLSPAAQCDPVRHPEVVVDSPSGRLRWRGKDALAVQTALLGPPADADAGLRIAAEAPPLVQRIAVHSCGLRDAGAPLGDLALEVQVFPAAQCLLDSRARLGGRLELPRKGDVPPPPQVQCRLQVDGESLPGAPWNVHWLRLQSEFEAGMERLLNAWSATGGLESVRLEAETQLMTGSSALTWGCCESGPRGVFMRLDAMFDLVACALDLRLAGDLVLDDARARVRLSLKDQADLRGEVRRDQPGVELAAVLEGGAQQRWRWPFVLDFEPVASPGLGTLAQTTPPALLGALVGAAGLRDNGDGAEWFFSLALQPAVLQLSRIDPVLGARTLTRPLLPALPLVDWRSAKVPG